MTEPAPYAIEHVRALLASGAGLGELDVHIAMEGSIVVLSGHVATAERRDAVCAVLTAELPDLTVHCDLQVPELDEPRDGELLA